MPRSGIPLNELSGATRGVPQNLRLTADDAEKSVTHFMVESVSPALAIVVLALAVEQHSKRCDFGGFPRCVVVNASHCCGEELQSLYGHGIGNRKIVFRENVLNFGGNAQNLIRNKHEHTYAS